MSQASTDWGPPPDEPSFEFQNEQYVAGAATALFHGGATEAARLLLEVSGCWWDRQTVRVDEWEDIAVLEVPPWTVSKFTPDIKSSIAAALCHVAGSREDQWPQEIMVTPRLPGPTWKSHLKKMLDEGPKNQARLVPLKPNYPQADGMAFRDHAEVRVYEALKAKQEALPKDDTFTIVPNSSVRIPGHTWEPDFLIIYKGRCCVIEVDGGTHRRKWAADKSRDELFQDAGIAFVKRIDRTDAMADKELYEFIERTLSKLTHT